MRWPKRPAAHRAIITLLVSFGIGLTIAAEQSAAAENLQLDVVINGVPTNKIGSFARLDDGRIGATTAELGELGLATNAKQAADQVVYLEELPATYRYDEPTQRIFIKVDNSRRVAHKYNGSNAESGPTPAQAGMGAVLNYDFLLSTGNISDLASSLFNGWSLTLDGRAFSRFGTFSQSAYVVSDQDWRTNAFRLDSTYRYSDQQRLRMFNAGDAITGGLPWTQPIRIGGFQVQSNFVLRPDLITVPLPGFSGTAAVPSTVDIYVNNIRTFSQDVDPGPFSISNIPVISGAGNAQVVVRDASGHKTTTRIPFYSAPNLLAPGLTSFSAEAGFARVGYGTAADAYLSSPVGAATVRRGVADWLTLEGHAEGGDGLLNLGGGVVAAIGHFGVASGAIAASTSRQGSGVMAYAEFNARFLGLNIDASTRRTFGAYNNLASATAFPATNALSNQALDRITIGTALPFDRDSSISASFVHSVDGALNTSNIVSASWSRTLPGGASIYATAFSDFGGTKRYGAYIGFSMRLFDSISTSTSVSSGTGGISVNVNAVKPLGPSPGSFGWQFIDSEGAAPYRQASVAYRLPKALLQATASESPNSVSGTAEVQGAVATMGGAVFLANRIDDAFAVVKAGAPNVPVLLDNRQIGVTDAQGKILVPGLRSYDKNQISIDPDNLPVDADIPATRTIVVPADRSGVLVDLGVHADTRSALVVFTHADGSMIPVGSSGRSDAGEEFVVGYDGQAFLRNLAPHNAVTIETPDGPCKARFDYAPKTNEQVVISAMCGGSQSDSAQPVLGGAEQ